jgi:hypothetical protein
MKVYLIEESDYDDVTRHGIYLHKEKAIKKLKSLFKSQKKYWGKNNAYHPEWINNESFGIFSCDTYQAGTFQIIEEEVID